MDEYLRMLETPLLSPLLEMPERTSATTSETPTAEQPKEKKEKKKRNRLSPIIRQADEKTPQVVSRRCQMGSEKERTKNTCLTTTTNVNSNDRTENSRIHSGDFLITPMRT